MLHVDLRGAVASFPIALMTSVDDAAAGAGLSRSAFIRRLSRPQSPGIVSCKWLTAPRATHE